MLPRVYSTVLYTVYCIPSKVLFFTTFLFFLRIHCSSSNCCCCYCYCCCCCRHQNTTMSIACIHFEELQESIQSAWSVGHTNTSKCSMRQYLGAPNLLKIGHVASTTLAWPEQQTTWTTTINLSNWTTKKKKMVSPCAVQKFGMQMARQ